MFDDRVVSGSTLLSMRSSSTLLSVSDFSSTDPTFLCSKSILFYHNSAHCSFLHLHLCFSSLLIVHSAYISATYTATFNIFSVRLLRKTPLERPPAGEGGVRLLSGYMQCDKYLNSKGH
jgi:hypothetical protein